MDVATETNICKKLGCCKEGHGKNPKQCLQRRIEYVNGKNWEETLTKDTLQRLGQLSLKDKILGEQEPSVDEELEKEIPKKADEAKGSQKADEAEGSQKADEAEGSQRKEKEPKQKLNSKTKKAKKDKKDKKRKVEGKDKKPKKTKENQGGGCSTD